MYHNARRKAIRLPEYDYSADGAYFITICTKNKARILSQVVGPISDRPPGIVLSEAGRVAEQAIQEIPKHYSGVYVDAYVIMPNHIHLLIRIEGGSGRSMIGPTSAPTLSRIIRQMKSAVTKRLGNSIWQDRFYDHIIRNEEDYSIRYQYIENNPANWLLKRDEYCTI